MMKTNIIISPSQQQYNKCVQNDSEADHCRLIAEKVVELLKRYDCNVWLVPKLEGSESDILQKVVNSSNYFVKTNPSYANYHLDIHTDAGYVGNGASGFYMSEGGKAFVSKIYKEIAALTPWSDGICSVRDLFVLRKTDSIAGLIELSFHDKPNETKWVHENMDQLAESIVKGIVNATCIEKKKIEKITDVDEAIGILAEVGIVSNVEYWLKCADIVPYIATLFLNVANYIKKV